MREQGPSGVVLVPEGGRPVKALLHKPVVPVDCGRQKQEETYQFPLALSHLLLLCYIHQYMLRNVFQIFHGQFRHFYRSNFI